MKPRFLEVPLNGGGGPRKLKGPGVSFNVNNVRAVPSEVSLCLKHLPETNYNVILPALGNNPLLPACISVLNPQSKLLIHQIDSHASDSVKKSLTDYKNIEFELDSDPDYELSEDVTAIFCISVNLDLSLIHI